MKYWMPGLVALMAVPTAQAMNYRLVYSPARSWKCLSMTSKQQSRKLVRQEHPAAHRLGAKPRSGGAERLSAARRQSVGKQCPKAGHLPWTLTDKRGEKLASGEAAKVHGWKPVVKQEAVEQGNPAAAGDPCGGSRDLSAGGHRASSAFQPAAGLPLPHLLA